MANKKACDCSKLPFKKECLKYCIEQILRTATPEEKQLVLGLGKQLTNAIFNAYSKDVVNSFEDLEVLLTPIQIDTLILKFESLSQYQLNYFNKSKRERQQIIDIIRNMRLDADSAFADAFAEE